MSVWILYDSVTNSVFESQVLTPAIKQLEKNKNPVTTIISFERNINQAKKILKHLKLPNNLKIILNPRWYFFGTFSLWLAAKQVCHKLHTIKPISIIARGPLAGWIALNILQRTSPKPSLTIQARGLASEEYHFAHKVSWKNPARWLMYKILNDIEQSVYGKAKTIEAVSKALKSYLVQTFKASPQAICIAKDDIPSRISTEKQKEWRNEIRKTLKINSEQTVYCYSGSAKPWQCAQETIEFFAQQLKKDKNVILLILSRNTKVFSDYLAANNIPQKSYRLLSVQPVKLIQYLCSADFGILLRKPHIINWVSRPTKALEYQAAGLKIIHNNTIDWLQK